MTTDMTAAETFYKPVVGWTTTPFDGAGMPYSMWTRPDGVPMGGVMTLPDELKSRQVPPHWEMYVGVDKLEDARRAGPAPRRIHGVAGDRRTRPSDGCRW